MGIAGPPLPHFLVEWYRPAVVDEPLDLSVSRLIECAAAISARGSQVNLRVALAIPGDEMVLAVFDSTSGQSVAEVCRRAGCPAQRVSAVVEARFWRES